MLVFLQEPADHEQDKCLVESEASYWCGILEWPPDVFCGAPDHEQGLPHHLPPTYYDPRGQETYSKTLYWI